MPIIDSQVHAYEANTPERSWDTVPNWPDHITGDEMITAMDAVGVDGAIFVSSFSMYRYDASYAVEVQRAQPDRLAIAKLSIRTIQMSPTSLPIGRTHRVRSRSGYSCARRSAETRTIPASTAFLARP